MKFPARFATLLLTGSLFLSSQAEEQEAQNVFKHKLFNCKVPSTLKHESTDNENVFTFTETGCEIRLIIHSEKASPAIIKQLSKSLLEKTRQTFDSEGYSNIETSELKGFTQGDYKGKKFTISGTSSKPFSLTHYIFPINPKQLVSLTVTTGSTASEYANEYAGKIIERITLNK